MSFQYSPGTVNAGSIVGLKTATGTQTNGTLTLFTTTTGKTAYIVALDLQLYNDNAGINATSTVTNDGTAILSCSASAKGTQRDGFVLPVGLGVAVPSGKILALVSPSAVLSTATVWYYEV
jgi:hypothetical protein